jgi:hypothetical protein
MTRRKFEITGHLNERDFPHVVDLELPPGGFRNKSLEFDAFHRERSIPIRRGRGRHEAEQFHVRFCFPDAATADAFQERFGGTRLTYSPSKPGRPSGPRVRYQRSYPPRIVGGKVMTPADLRRLHKYMLEIEGIDHISDEMRALSKASGLSWHTSCRRTGREAELIPRPVGASPENREAKESPGVSPGAFKERP